MTLRDEMKLQFSKDLLEKRELHLFGEINFGETERILASILWLNASSDSKEIIFYINSGGGDVVTGLIMYDAVRICRAPITGVVIGEANSMASVVLQACKKRKAARHAHLILHTLIVRRSLCELNKENIEKSLSKMREYQDAIFKIFSERSGMSIEQVKKICEESRVIGSEEAKELNLIDEII